MWLKLHSRLLCLQPTFKKTPKACKSKFNDVYNAYKDDKLANNISGESRHTCKFYDSMGTWYHQNGSVLKHVSASSSDMPYREGDGEEVKVENLDPMPPSTSKLAKSGGKIKYQESALEIMGQLAVSSQNMAESMKEATGFMSNLDRHIERLIEKL